MWLEHRILSVRKAEYRGTSYNETKTETNVLCEAELLLFNVAR